MAYSTYAANPVVLYSQKLIQRTYEKSIALDITNQDYEGEIKDKTSVLKITSLLAPSFGNYTGSLTYSDPSEIVATFTTDQEKSVAMKIRDISKFKATIKEPKNKLVEQWSSQLGNLWDAYVLSFHADAGAGNWYGTSYTTGTVAIDAAGAVTGTGTTFTAAMVGKPFKALGHTEWYRVKTYTSGTAIVIEDDSDDTTSAYSGGVISAGATYEIQANTVKTVDNSTTKMSDVVQTLKQMLDERKGVPATDRFIVLPPVGNTYILKDTTFKWDTTSNEASLLEKGYLGTIYGFKIYVSNFLAGDNSSGFQVLFGHKDAITFAEGLDKGPEMIRLESDFADGFREMHVYGAKVADERRKFLGKAFIKFS